MVDKATILDKLYSIHRRGREGTTSGEAEPVCPVCGGRQIVRAPDGHLVCRDCGTVIEDRPIDLGPEWRAFTAEEAASRARTGPAPKIRAVASMMLTTEIEAAPGNELLRKLEKLQKRVFVSTSRERALLNALAEAERIATVLGLPKAVIDDALRLFDRAYQEGLHVGRTVRLVVTACLYLACRVRGIARTLDDFVDASGESWRAVAEACRVLMRRLNLRLPLADPKVFVDKICQQLRLSGRVAREAKNILDEARKRRVTAGKDPAGLAAAAVYIACLLHGEVRSQKDVARVAGVTEVTIRNRYKELVQKLELRVLQPQPLLPPHEPRRNGKARGGA